MAKGVSTPQSGSDRYTWSAEDEVLGILPQPETMYSKLVNSLSGILWEADGQTFQFTFVSPQGEQILGYPLAEWFEPNFWRDHTHPDDTDWCAAFCLDATARRKDHEFEYRMIAADGRVIWFHDIVSVKVEADGSVCLRGIMLDISERKRAEEERTRLLRQLITAQEDERRRISRELHDNIGQYLAALLIGLESLSRVADLPPEALNQLFNLKGTTKQFEHDVHRFALELRPTALDDLGLEAALIGLLRHWEARHYQRIRATFNSVEFANHNQRLLPEVEVAIYRVVQEALTNVLRHSYAANVSVLLERHMDYARVVIEDDGIGYDVQAIMKDPDENRRLGLTGMRERIELVGGEFKIDSRPGTTIVITIPHSHCSPADEESHNPAIVR